MTELAKSGGGYAGTFQQSGNHNHSVNINIPSHSHSVQVQAQSHTHEITIAGHTHDTIYGIYEDYANTSYEININGVSRTYNLTGKSNLTATESELNIASYLIKGAWNIIEIRGNGRGRVNASIFIQALLQFPG